MEQSGHDSSSYRDINQFIKNYRTYSQLGDEQLFNLSQSSRVSRKSRGSSSSRNSPIKGGTYGTIGSLVGGSEGYLDLGQFTAGIRNDDARTIIERLMNTRKVISQRNNNEYGEGS